MKEVYFVGICAFAAAAVLLAASFFVRSLSSKELDTALYKLIIIICAVNTVLAALDASVLPYVPATMPIVFAAALGLAAAMIQYLCVIGVCSKKIGENEKTDPENTPERKAALAAAAVTPLALILIAAAAASQISTIRSSELIIKFHSSGNGGIFDGSDFSYAVSENGCKEIKNFTPLFIPAQYLMPSEMKEAKWVSYESLGEDRSLLPEYCWTKCHGAAGKDRFSEFIVSDFLVVTSPDNTFTVYKKGKYIGVINTTEYINNTIQGFYCL